MNFSIIWVSLLILSCKADKNATPTDSVVQKQLDTIESVISEVLEVSDTKDIEQVSKSIDTKLTQNDANENLAESETTEEDERPPVEEAKSYGGTLEQVDKPGVDATAESAGRHDIFDALLMRYVSTDGRVDYKGFKSESSELDKYLDKLSTTDPSSLGADEELAFWINAYNAFTIKLILDNYPIQSILDTYNAKPWDVKWINLNGKTMSLNQIENEIIRPKFNEPRIHFAVNCAAKSCPPLLNKAWTKENLESHLEEQTRLFINNSRYNSISPDRVAVSKIFDWYASDFGNLIDFLNAYSERQINDEANIVYLEYDWSLNN